MGDITGLQVLVPQRWYLLTPLVEGPWSVGPALAVVCKSGQFMLTLV